MVLPQADRFVERLGSEPMAPGLPQSRVCLLVPPVSDPV